MERIRYTASNVLQNKTKFYSLTMPTDVLSKCCFVSSRDEDPLQGFQRVLDKNRAVEIAKYIDEDFGTIPSAIILSAQEEADVKSVGSGRTLEFTPHPKAFLILDGQHRVYGFTMAKTAVRVPVIIYTGLSRKQETRLFIDINSKQKGVPTELLLDIQRMAEYEKPIEQSLRDIFDIFHNEPSSSLYGKLSPSKKINGKISRVTFNSALKPMAKFFGDRESDEIYEILNCYLQVFLFGFFKPNKIEEKICTPVVFRAIFSVWPEIAAKVKDKFGPSYNVDNYNDVMKDMFSRLTISQFKKPGTSYKVLAQNLSKSIQSVFSL